MAKETEDRIWAQTRFYLTNNPPAVGDFVVLSGVASVVRSNLGTYVVTLDAGIDAAEEVLALCAAADPKTFAMRQACVTKDSDTQYTINLFDSGGADADAPIGFTVQRVRHTATP